MRRALDHVPGEDQAGVPEFWMTAAQANGYSQLDSSGRGGRIGLALAPVSKGLPGSSIRCAEPRIICVDAMDSMGRCRQRTRSHYAYRRGS